MKRSAPTLAAAVAGLAALTAAPASADPAKLSLSYDGRLLVKVLDIHLDEQFTATGYSAASHLQSYGVLALFKKLNQRASAVGQIEGGQAEPGTFRVQNLDGKKNRKVTTTWVDRDVISTSDPAYDNLGSPPATRAQKLAAADPLTQLVRITLASTRAGPCAGDTHFFDGKQLYQLDFVGARPTTLNAHQQRLGLTNPIRCNVTFKEVAGFKAKPPEKRNQGLDRPITVDFAQMGPGGLWVMTDIQAQTPLGPAVIELKTIDYRR